MIEVGNDAFGHFGADALDEARAEIAADALDRRRQHSGVAAHLELAAVLRMALPHALHAQALAGLGAEEGADDGEQVAATPARGDAGDRVAGLLVGVGDALKDRLQCRQRGMVFYVAAGGGHAHYLSPLARVYPGWPGEA
jgi:hypothetical protein